jgi:phosphate butyryltransferase
MTTVKNTGCLRTFPDLERIVALRSARQRVLVVAAHDVHTLQGVDEAYRKGIIEPILIGDKDAIQKIIAEQSLSIGSAKIIEAADDADCARQAADMAAAGLGDVIMKGRLQTADLMREVVDKKRGLLVGKIMSHVGLFSVPAFPKLVALTDGGMVIAPDIEGKRSILNNAVRTLSAIGVENPKVAVLCATETVNSKMPASEDADYLKKANAKGLIEGCVVDGPISFDLACDMESVRIKGYESPVAGDADILLMPDMTAGNLVAKALMLGAKGMMAGLIVGARLPIVLVSRGATAEEKYWSLVFAAAVSGTNQVAEENGDV